MKAFIILFQIAIVKVSNKLMEKISKAYVL